jgi:hypothetical protein
LYQADEKQGAENIASNYSGASISLFSYKKFISGLKPPRSCGMKLTWDLWQTAFMKLYQNTVSTRIHLFMHNALGLFNHLAQINHI